MSNVILEGKTFVVGGFVRNHLLNIEVNDIDIVVVGSHHEEMISLGFEQVGKAFPVYLHPETGDEFALARKEVSTGDGHQDFEFHTEDVTLEEDLFRRDFTMNAMAMPVEVHSSGSYNIDTTTLIDPYKGKSDLDAEILRPVSDHFMEDPLRILRAVRFRCQYGFVFSTCLVNVVTTIAMRTPNLLEELSQERVLAELDKIARSAYPEYVMPYLRLFTPFDSVMFSITQDNITGLNLFSQVENTLKYAGYSDYRVRLVLFYATLLLATDKKSFDDWIDKVKFSKELKRQLTLLCRFHRIITIYRSPLKSTSGIDVARMLKSDKDLLLVFQWGMVLKRFYTSVFKKTQINTLIKSVKDSYNILKSEGHSEAMRKLAEEGQTSNPDFFVVGKPTKEDFLECSYWYIKNELEK
ncbi:tRNA nucleotidyltransferase [Pseudoalteromonas phage J2-1_QLiu-2017]|nr:tRNA nucleotidyltransferase [Pseudoalteromonas phage J2-1_QLiu-2017]